MSILDCMSSSYISSYTADYTARAKAVGSDELLSGFPQLTENAGRAAKLRKAMPVPLDVTETHGCGTECVQGGKVLWRLGHTLSHNIQTPSKPWITSPKLQVPSLHSPHPQRGKKHNRGDWGAYISSSSSVESSVYLLRSRIPRKCLIYSAKAMSRFAKCSFSLLLMPTPAHRNQSRPIQKDASQWFQTFSGEYNAVMVCQRSA